MARPTKAGLDYFPLDVDIDQDDKIAIIEASHGIEGFAIVIKLFMKIYDNGYYYEWGEKEQLLFVRRVNVDINRVNVIINDCLKWGIFDQNTYERTKILTSKGIQRRYLEATNRRKRVEIRRDLLLLDAEDINAYKNLIIVDINSQSDELMLTKNPQSKVKESKVKKSKVKQHTQYIEYAHKEKIEPEKEDKAAANYVSEIVKLYESNIKMMSPIEIENVSYWLDENPFPDTPTMIKLAIREAAENNGRSWRYIETILHRWIDNGIMNPELVQKERERNHATYRRSNTSGNGKGQSYGGASGGKYGFDPKGPAE